LRQLLTKLINLVINSSVICQFRVTFHSRQDIYTFGIRVKRGSALPLCLSHGRN
jgi:hypothetical protein